MDKKRLEYSPNLCYSRDEVIVMVRKELIFMDVLMKGLYDKVAADYDVKPSKVNKVVDHFNLYLQSKILY